MTRGIPLHKRLLVRLLITSVLIAVCSVAATAWLAVQTTTRALREEQGQVLADDMDILQRLSGYAATHADWSGVDATVRALSAKTGRRIALTTVDRSVVVDSAAHGTSLPPRASATVDPLHTDTFTDPGAQSSGIDPRAVGPFRLTAAERAASRAKAEKQQECLTHAGLRTTLMETPTGRSLIVDEDGDTVSGYDREQCAGEGIYGQTHTEEKALDALIQGARSCLTRQQVETEAPLYITLDVWDRTLRPRAIFEGSPVREDSAAVRTAQSCVDSARRAQLDPYVAPAAELFLGTGDTIAPRFDMSPANKAKVVGAAGLVLALTVVVTAVVATRLVRPLRALTRAAQQPPELHLRVPVTTRDETGVLAEAFNDLADRRERLETQRKALISDIAHELRTPLTNIRGWLEVTRDGTVDPEPALLDSLHEEALLLQRVIDDLQDLASADAGTLRLHPESVRTDELLAQVAAAHRVAADAAGVALLTKGDDVLWLHADPVRMRQALGNLVSNAIRHTPADGTITLTARREPAGGGHGGHGDRAERADRAERVVFEVADTGSGIAPEDLPHVFDRFWRAEKSRSRRTGGSGLGLSIVRQLVAAHGGTVEAASEPGVGSVFSLSLPAQPAGVSV
ncbi:HAMP domain-containing sensor histidine kinase [Streptomyces sp. NPDC005820]|uniref:sensor histidine kinase n=1 Tax=Streptomyces sp. NPDC005820 TaxID=3157069 RepID=UPI0033C38FE7